MRSSVAVSSARAMACLMGRRSDVVARSIVSAALAHAASKMSGADREPRSESGARVARSPRTPSLLPVSLLRQGGEGCWELRSRGHCTTRQAHDVYSYPKYLIDEVRWRLAPVKTSEPVAECEFSAEPDMNPNTPVIIESAKFCSELKTSNQRRSPG